MASGEARGGSGGHGFGPGLGADLGADLGVGFEPGIGGGIGPEVGHEVGPEVGTAARPGRQQDGFAAAAPGHSLERTEAGRAILSRLESGNEARLRALLGPVAPDLTDMILGFFGDVYARPGLPLRDRMLVTLSALAALGHAGPQLAAHVRNALNAGLTRQEIAEVFMQVFGYAGFPASINALTTARAVFDDIDNS